MIIANPILSGSVSISGSLSVNGGDIRAILTPIIDTTTTTVNSTSSIQVVEITGSNFESDAIGYLFDTNATRRNPTTSIRISETNIKLTYSGSDRLISANEPYDIEILNGTGQTAKVLDTLYVDASPVWVTNSGKLGDVFVGSSLTSSFFISASDPDSNDTVSYSVTSGAIPSGLSFLTSSGEITGSGAVTAGSDTYNASGVNNNFTIEATDGTSTLSRSFYITKKWLDGSTEALAVEKAADLTTNLNITADGYYWIKPDGVNAYYVYCDLNTHGGGNMLMIRIKADSGYTGTTNDFNLQTVDSNTGVVKHDHSNSNGFGATVFTKFLEIPGTKTARIEYTNVSPTGYDGLYFRLGTGNYSWPGGSGVECTNRSALTASDKSWILTAYPSYTDASNNTNGETGTYTSANHYYPSIYPSANTFYKGNESGMRVTTDGFTGGTRVNNGEGYFWVQVL